MLWCHYYTTPGTTMKVWRIRKCWLFCGKRIWQLNISHVMYGWTDLLMIINSKHHQNISFCHIIWLHRLFQTHKIRKINLTYNYISFKKITHFEPVIISIYASKHWSRIYPTCCKSKFVIFNGALFYGCQLNIQYQKKRGDVMKISQLGHIEGWKYENLGRRFWGGHG